jgi:KUP system potassium uptake protein
VPAINWGLLVAVILTVIFFQNSSAIAAAYGIAVTGTMLITSILTYFVVRNIWKYPLWLAAGATSIFIALDVMLLASCSVKFFKGGWFPIALAVIMVVIMWTWKQGRKVLLNSIHNDDPKLDDFIKSIAGSEITHVERTAVYLSANVDTVPQALMHNLKHNQVLHQTNLIITVEFTDQPNVPMEQRFDVKTLEAGFWQIKLYFGFMDSPDVPKALQHVDIPNLSIDAFTTSYFLSRETIISGHGGAMAKWRDDLFVFMSRNSGSAVDFFNIPSNSVIELGSRVHI